MFVTVRLIDQANDHAHAPGPTESDTVRPPWFPISDHSDVGCLLGLCTSVTVSHEAAPRHAVSRVGGCLASAVALASHARPYPCLSCQ